MPAAVNTTAKLEELPDLSFVFFLAGDLQAEPVLRTKNSLFLAAYGPF
jgi:hypothetical protein